MITPVSRRGYSEDENEKRKVKKRLIRDTTRVESLFSGDYSDDSSGSQQQRQQQQQQPEEHPIYNEFHNEENTSQMNNIKTVEDIALIDVNPYARNYLDLDNIDIQDF